MIDKVLVIFLLLGIALILNKYNIRLCPFFNLFKIPCPGCGMTRAVKLIFQGKFLDSFKYNILALPLIIALIIYVILYIIFRDKLKALVNKYRSILITIAVIIMLISWIININNKLLY